MYIMTELLLLEGGKGETFFLVGFPRGASKLKGLCICNMQLRGQFGAVAIVTPVC